MGLTERKPDVSQFEAVSRMFLYAFDHICMEKARFKFLIVFLHIYL